MSDEVQPGTREGKVFADLDDTIKQLLIRHVPLDLSGVDVSFEAPDREWSGRLSRPTVNCFLYDVRENLEFRQTDWEIERHNGTATLRKGPVRIDTTYQVTVWARAPEDEHHLLWGVLSALMRHQTLPEDVLQGGLKTQSQPLHVQVAQPNQARSNPADLWQAVDNRIRPALTYVVTLALDPQVTFTSPLVFTRTARVRDENSGDTAQLIEIGGRVRDKSHHAIAGARVRLRETGVEVSTDAEGRFVFPRVPQGSVTIVVGAPGRKEVDHRVTVPAPDNPTKYDVEV